MSESIRTVIFAASDFTDFTFRLYCFLIPLKHLHHKYDEEWWQKLVLLSSIDFALFTQSFLNSGIHSDTINLFLGTTGPVWLNDTLPENVNQTLTRKICIRTGTNCCSHHKLIRVKRCSSFFVFYLDHTFFPVSYCAG